LGGAFGCGVFEALANNNNKVHIVACTSIAGSKRDHPERG
jgi:hypothetical protein